MPRPVPITRRRLLLGFGLGLGPALLAGCGSSPPVLLYHLNADRPEGATLPAPTRETWQLVLPVRLPEYLDREAILVPRADSGLLALSGQRWAESLRDAVPRVLRQDLAAWLGPARLWVAPVPAGVVVTRQLRVELLAFDIEPGRSAVRLQALWTLVDPSGRTAPLSDSATLRVGSSGSDIGALVAAHRLALWQLAGRIAVGR
ncbi:MAG: membrane integrity-associated transporter subunit PqiC [Rubrivivax sp.]|jgi:uncharacterized lipoprotein YmbA|nr:membrane integrity-associated transporter subunit PqiC [Rubrivivax sp.]